MLSRTTCGRCSRSRSDQATGTALEAWAARRQIGYGTVTPPSYLAQMAAEDTARTLRCDCGFIANAGADAELVEIVQAHALDQHGLKLDPALILHLAQLDGNHWLTGRDRSRRAAPEKGRPA